MRPVLLFFSAILACACGSNVFAPAESADPAQDAVVLLEQGESQRAINKLEKALLDDPGNPQYLSVLAMAYAQRAGLDPIDYALRLAGSDQSEDDNNGSSGGNSITAAFDIMPAATSQNLADINYALELLLAIDAADRIPADVFKIALFQVSVVTLTAKALDTNGDGELTPFELLQLGDSAAELLVTQISAARALLEAGGGDGAENSDAVAEKFAAIENDIDSSEGSDNAEKLRNFLASSG